MNKAQRNIDDINFIIDEIKRLGSMSRSDMKSHIEANENNHDFLYTIKSPSGKGEYVCGREASRRLYELAKRHLATQKTLEDNLHPSRLKDLLKTEIVRNFFENEIDVSQQQLQKMLSKAIKALKSANKAVTHYIPCVLFSVHDRNSLRDVDPKEFEIGPVKFIRMKNFFADYSDEFESYRERIRSECLAGEDERKAQDCKAIDEADEHARFMTDSLTTFFSSYDWIAVVSVPECDADLSRLRAETAIESALDTLKLLFGASRGQHLRQGESRFRASKTARLTREASGRLNISVGITVAEDIPISAEVFEVISKAQDFHLRESGKAIVACVDPACETHLARRFLDALTWYGQAVTEPLHSAQIIKYVAAWERLTITKKYQDNQLTERVTNRMALLSHDGRDSTFEKTLTEVRKVYDWRSKLMHGSVSPFQKDLDHISYRASVISGNALFRSLELFACLAHSKRNPTEEDLELAYMNIEENAGLTSMKKPHNSRT